MDKIIPLRMNQVLIGDLDHLVQKGIFPNRNEGMRSSIRSMLFRYRRRETDGHFLVAQIIANYLIMNYTAEIQAVYLFGSVATQTHDKESDIDLLILISTEISYESESNIIGGVIDLVGNLPFYPSLHFQNIANFRYGLEHGFEFESTVKKKGVLMQGQI